MATTSAPRHPWHPPRRAARARGLAVGIDMGGTWVRIASAWADGRAGVLALPSPRDPSRLAHVLRRIWRRRGWTRAGVAALVVASRGVWTRDERSALARRLRRFARRVRVVSDAQAALHGALSGRPGVLILAGTGSIVVGLDPGGRWARAGGLGPLIGDEGSAFWLGREWLRATSSAGRWRAALEAVRAREPVARIAALAPAVLRRARQGDQRARSIVRRAQNGLAAHTRDVILQLGLPRPVDASWAGGVLESASFRAGVRRALARHDLRIRWRRPEMSPVAATLRMAEELSGRVAVSGARRGGPRRATPRAP